MKKISIVKVGGPEVLQIVEADIPQPGPGEVLIQVKHAGVAFADIIIRQGKYHGAPPLPATPGYDVCGVITAIGLQETTPAEELAVGDTVLALTQFGGYAEYCTVPRDQAFKVPKDTNSAEAVCLVLNYITAYEILNTYKKLSPGDKVVVFSAAGGVGTAVLQMARAMGLETHGICSGSKMNVVEKNGGQAIDYSSEDVPEVLRNRLGDGADLVLDPIGRKHLEMSRTLVKKGGYLIGYGFFNSFRQGEFTGSLWKDFLKFIGLRYFRPGLRFRFYSINPGDTSRIRPAMRAVMELYQSGKIRPVIGAELPLHEASKAHEMLGTGASHGKIVLRCIP